uniref:Uncharacterized protein n=1 Tax=Anopheles culicifacies TaxID=139723 RepID=A0A182M3T5_9DIPT
MPSTVLHRPPLSIIHHHHHQYIRPRYTANQHLHHHHHHQYTVPQHHIPNRSSCCHCKTILLASRAPVPPPLLLAPLPTMVIITALVMVLAINTARTFQPILFILSCPLPNPATISSLPILLDSLKRDQIRSWIVQYQKYVLFC